MELMIAITLVAMLSTGLLMAMRTGLMTYDKVEHRLDINRRAVNVQQILTSQLAAAMSVPGACPSSDAQKPAALLPFFMGDDKSLRFVTTYSIAEGSRGYPQIVEYQVLPVQGGGVQLAVGERPYTGLSSTTPFCQDLQVRPVNLAAPGVSATIVTGTLTACRFAYHPAYDAFTYLEKPWVPVWNIQSPQSPQISPAPPSAVRIEMLGASIAGLPVPSITVPVRTDRSARDLYEDMY